MINKTAMLTALDELIRGAEELRKQFWRDLLPWSNEFVAWYQAAGSTVETIFGSRSHQYTKYKSIHFLPPPGEQYANDAESEKAKLVWFDSGLNFAQFTLLGFRYAVQRLAPEDSGARPSPFIFLSHGGPSRQRVDETRDFLEALGLKALIVVDLPNLNMSINSKVARYMSMCSAGIALATVEDETLASEKRTRPNVEHEIGMMQTLPNIGGRIVYLKEAGVQFASNYAEKVWIEFRKEDIQLAFVPILRELRAFGMIGWGE